MSRLQLALNVTDLDAAIEFYSKLFKTPTHKVRPGYANFEVEDPPLKLVLFEGDKGGTLNHLGVEVFSTDQVVETASRLQSEGLDTEMEESNLCCHAVQDKMWVTGPDSQRWEVYNVIDDEPEELLQISAKPAS